ncbi:MAG: GlsB/YeaQ/YmgE family stress response membrane protein [Dermatophilaceae bacterium]|nr:GlsB/YeaQ/YmgE family stress response membrane protein [Intrasporangiaceae bacterium]
MFFTIISAIILGAIIGAVARLILPGRQSISLLVTVILGILGSLVGSWVVYRFGYEGSGGFEVIPFVAGVVAAAVLIVVYGLAIGRKQV